MISRVVERNEAGQRADKFLRKLFPEAPSSLIYKWLRKKSITCNGKKMDGSEKLEQGDLLNFFLSEETYLKFQGKGTMEQTEVSSDYGKWSPKIPVIYQDEDVLILNKPAGILSQKGDNSDYSVADFVRDYCIDKTLYSAEELKTFHPAVANRLDRNTSGLILCGISLKGLQELGGLIAERSLTKEYRAIVKGRLSGKEGYLTGIHKKDQAKNQVVILDPKLHKTYEEAEKALEELKASQDKRIKNSDPKESADRKREMEYGSRVALTGYRVLEEVKTSSGSFTMVCVTLYTGYSHQIRAHFASIGHPLAGDPKYGNKSSGREAKRQMLHAERLVIPEEVKALPELSGKTFTADIPGDMKKFWDDLKGEV